MKLGKLYGVGVGPGAPDLLTLRAARILTEAPVLAIPRSNAHTPSMAWRTAEAAIGDVEGQTRLHLVFPMTKDPAKLQPAWQAALDVIGVELEAGRDVAFLTMGDPLLYSTYQYLRIEAKKRWSELELEVVPGVSCLTAVPAAADLAIADGQERIAVVPGSYGLDDLDRLVRDFDTVLLMKVKTVMPRIREVVREAGLEGRAVYVSKASQPDELVEFDLDRVGVDGPCDYFSMVMIRKGTRAGLLAGTSEESRP